MCTTEWRTQNKRRIFACILTMTSEEHFPCFTLEVHFCVHTGVRSFTKFGEKRQKLLTLVKDAEWLKWYFLPPVLTNYSCTPMCDFRLLRFRKSLGRALCWGGNIYFQHLLICFLNSLVSKLCSLSLVDTMQKVISAPTQANRAYVVCSAHLWFCYG